MKTQALSRSQAYRGHEADISLKYISLIIQISEKTDRCNHVYLLLLLLPIPLLLLLLLLRLLLLYSSYYYDDY